MTSLVNNMELLGVNQHENEDTKQHGSATNSLSPQKQTNCKRTLLQIENVVVTKKTNDINNDNDEHEKSGDRFQNHTMSVKNVWKSLVCNTYMQIKYVKFHSVVTDKFQQRLKNLPHFMIREINSFLTGADGFCGCHSNFCMSEDVSGRTNLGPAILKSVKVKNYLHMVANAYYNEKNKFNKYALWFHHSEMGMAIMTLDAASYILERFCNYLETITRLDLKWKHINDSMAVAMSNALRINISLRSLDFSRNEIRQRGAIALAEALKENCSLEILKLNDNSINDVACEAFSEMLLTNSTLLELDLGGNRISDYGINLLLNAMPINETLKTLNVASNRGITEEWKLNFLKEYEAKISENVDEVEDGNNSIGAIINRVVISNYDLATAYDPR